MNLRDLFVRLRALAGLRRVDHEIHDELAFHLDHETHKHIAAGLSPAEARTRALVTSCVLAASVPALRAARLDPIATLRTD